MGVGYHNNNEAYDPATNTWTGKAAMPTARRNLSVRVAAGKVYAIAGDGSGGDALANEEYDPATNTWATRAAMPHAVRNAAEFVVDDLLYIAAGSWQAKVVAYDPATNTWTAKADSPLADSYIASGAFGGKGYIGKVRGYTYNPAANSWSTSAASSRILGSNAATGDVAQERLFAAGNDPPVLDAYDPSTDTWTAKANPPNIIGTGYHAASFRR